MSVVSQRARRVRRRAARLAEEARRVAAERAAWEAANGLPFPPFNTLEERQVFLRGFLTSDAGLERIGPECGKVLLDTLEYVWKENIRPGVMPAAKKC